MSVKKLISIIIYNIFPVKGSFAKLGIVINISILCSLVIAVNKRKSSIFVILNVNEEFHFEGTFLILQRLSLN